MTPKDYATPRIAAAMEELHLACEEARRRRLYAGTATAEHVGDALGIASSILYLPHDVGEKAKLATKLAVRVEQLALEGVI